MSSVALTFFAFLGFGVVTFTAKDLAEPARELPRAMFLALGIATIIYIAVALGVFGTLTVKVDHVGRHGHRGRGPASPWARGLLADERHRPLRYLGATNAGLFPASGLCEQLATTRQFPPILGRRFGARFRPACS